VSEYTIFTVFDTQSNKQLRSISYVFDFIKAATSRGFDFLGDYTGEKVLNIDRALEIASQDRTRAIRDRRTSDHYRFQKRGLYPSVGFDVVNWNLFTITVSSRCFSHNQKERLQTIHDLVQFFEIAYDVFAPDYGYGLTSPEIYPVGISDLQTVPDIIFDINFFGPNLVERMGKEKLSSCPTWRTVNFDDGGILLQLSEDPVEQPEGFKGNYTQTAAILGASRTIFDL